MAERILNRDLYKCFDIGRVAGEGNRPLQFQNRVMDRYGDSFSQFLKDDHTVQLYKAYDFEAQAALKMILVKPESASGEPRDIEDVSKVVQALREETRNWRPYAPDKTEFPTLKKILEEVTQ